MAVPTESNVMSMYSDLLAASLDESLVLEDAPAGEMLVMLLASRDRLTGSSQPALAPKSAADLAVHLAYDRALITFCRARGIESDPSRFSDLHHERSRLEGELERMGVDLKSLAAATPKNDARSIGHPR